MRFILATTIICVLAACSSSPTKAPVATKAASNLTLIDQARANNQHWKASDLIAAFPASSDENYRPPARLAVMLPQTGSTLAIAGKAIRDGILAGYYAETRQKPSIRFYNSQGTAEGAISAYNAAVKDGAQMIIGPIGKEEVTALAAITTSIPILALNTVDAQNNKMLLSFSLSPEREGELLAKRLLTKKHLKISVFSQNSEPNNRILASMQKVFNAGGGAIISTMPTPRFSTDTSTGVITPPVMPANLLQAQAIVLIMPSNDAKSVKSALSLNSASAIPLLATASVFDTNNAQLEGIEFMQMPWLIGQSNAANVYSGQLSKLPSAKSVSGSRLNAFGVDAWLISTHLQAWLNNPNGELNGATGSLHLEPNGTIELKLPWFVIRNGVPQPADVGQP